MSQSQSSERAALDQIERNGRLFRLTLIGAAIVEGLLVLLMVVLIDFKDRGQVLMLISTLGVFNLLALGLTVVAVYARRNTLTILQAIEAARRAA